MDPSLMSDEEIEARGRVIIDPCQRDSCRHNWQIHVEIPRIDPENLWFGHLPPITACLVCACQEFIRGEPI